MVFKSCPYCWSEWGSQHLASLSASWQGEPEIISSSSVVEQSKWTAATPSIQHTHGASSPCSCSCWCNFMKYLFTSVPSCITLLRAVILESVQEKRYAQRERNCKRVLPFFHAEGGLCYHFWWARCTYQQGRASSFPQPVGPDSCLSSLLGAFWVPACVPNTREAAVNDRNTFLLTWDLYSSWYTYDREIKQYRYCQTEMRACGKAKSKAGGQGVLGWVNSCSLQDGQGSPMRGPASRGGRRPSLGPLAE